MIERTIRPIEDAAASVGDRAAAPRRGAAGLDVLFVPQSIAIIGASTDPAKMSGRPLANFRRFGFAGRVYPVNARSEVVQGYRAFPSIAAIGEAVDLTMVMTPSAAAVEAVKEGLEAGSRSFIIYSAGYAELDSEGRERQDELARLVAASGVRLLGPNCTGMINCAARACATFSTVVDQMEMREGTISFVGQSGAMAAYWLEKSLSAGLGFAKWISTGNEADISLADAILYLTQDPATAVICLYLEGTRDGPALRHALEAALDADKPVLALRAGRSVEGAAAAASHTGAMTGEDAVWSALFRQSGVIECRSLNDMIDVTRLLQRRPRGPIRRPLIMSVSGGAGALITDEAAGVGLEVAPLPEALGADVHRILPTLGKLSNPLDLTANAAADHALFRATADAVVKDDSFDSFIIFLGLMSGARDAIPRAIEDILCASGRPVILIWMSASAEVSAELRRRRIAAFDDIPNALAAVAGWNRWATTARRRVEADRPREPQPQPRAAAGAFLSEHAGQRRLGAMTHLTWPAARLVQSAEALDATALPPPPWVAKMQSGAMPHKTEHGAIEIGIRSPEDLSASVARLLAIGERLGPAMEGVLVQQMVPHRHELLVGLRTDPIFGGLLVVGRGGTEAELEKDLVLRLLPLSTAEIEDMLRGLRYAPSLAGARGAAGVNLPAVAAAIAELVRRFETDPALVEIEINPLAVSPGGPVAALDLLVTLGEVPAGATANDGATR